MDKEKTLEELITQLRNYHLDENNKGKRKKPVYLGNLTDDEKKIYHRENRRLLAKKNYKPEKRKEYNEKNSEMNKAWSSYNYYKLKNKLDIFEQKKPRYFQIMVEKGVIQNF
tara:strand:+ start:1361 stop:1696 length:336 start_codon:yes stop_codon:yes gene_type:complete